MNTTFPPTFATMADTKGLFSDFAIPLPRKDYDTITHLIKEIESRFLKDKKYEDGKTFGIFTSYDFHIQANGPQLIEINTNAGGSVLFASYLRSKNDFGYFPNFEDDIVHMFESEWRSHAGDRDLKTLCILDESPESQFLYPEFLLVKGLLEKKGYTVFILDPKDLHIEDDRLMYDRTVIDFVYNRLTDFYFCEQKNKVLKEAFERNISLISPNPTHYNTLANKTNLVVLSKDELLKSNIPETVVVTTDNKPMLFADRKKFFFKPISGHGSKAVYCGEKITSKVWETINEEYVAQLCNKAPKLDEEHLSLRYDVRFITYKGTILFILARLYSGQATNLRTEGGGFAKVEVENLVLDA